MRMNNLEIQTKRSLISIIVPVYNVENYLPRCIDSILKQSYENFELLLVDDGSIDSSGSICDLYADKDSRIHVFHKKNGGLSDARNYALEHAVGDYITFIDSDDYVGIDYLRILFEAITENSADISTVKFIETYSMKTEFCESTDERAVFNGEQVFKEMVTDRYYGVTACSKMYKRELFRNTRFPVNKVYEDYFTIPIILIEGKACASSTSVQYYYFQRADSITKSVSSPSVQMCMEASDNLLAKAEKKSASIRLWAESQVIKCLFRSAIDWYLYSSSYVMCVSNMKKKYIRQFAKGVFLPAMSLKERFKILLFMINIRLYRWARKLWIEGNRNPAAKVYKNTTL